LHVAVELGVPVAVSACLAGLWLVARARPWQESDATRQLAWAVLAVIVLHSLVEYPLWYGPFQMAVAGCVWLVWGFREDRGDRQNLWLNRSLGPVLCAWAAIIIIVFVVFAGWNYWRVSQLYLPATLRASGYQDSTAEKVRNSWFFQDQVRFAELTTTELTRNNADHLNTLAREMLHFSPEPRVVEKCIESAVMLGRDDEALFFLRRFKAAFPQEHAHWAEVSGSRKNAAQQPLR
jgi:hypothetical protein